ncbi:hypothetical protein DFA_02207 [Cavenderia fasciculata]|uniref:Uncharacterized protein n=1 Tax=Cavenderia fasciculata TaxID=261658 RepID=F4PYF3_CACFS|nr:uncharacterized protein DFA_02207 [Cavenderia fasciculata]EGG19420.1 hypothetical protein DFA_02207 [Cavenderia fasciculata]|eukprot:XP_004357691.1 hypothetical protein DFA_02207 [Cavenderia fasciculata]
MENNNNNKTIVDNITFLTKTAVATSEGEGKGAIVVGINELPITSSFSIRINLGDHQRQQQSYILSVEFTVDIAFKKHKCLLYNDVVADLLTTNTITIDLPTLQQCFVRDQLDPIFWNNMSCINISLNDSSNSDKNIYKITMPCNLFNAYDKETALNQVLCTIYNPFDYKLSSSSSSSSSSTTTAAAATTS